MSQMPTKYRVTQNGDPISFGKVYFYQSGTSTPLATYQNAGLTIANTNPVTLDANGDADVYLGPYSYRESVYTSGGSLVRVRDGVAGDLMTVREADARFVRLGQATAVNVTTSSLIANVRTYDAAITGFDAYVSGIVISIIPDVVSTSDTSYKININGLGVKDIVTIIGDKPSLVAGQQAFVVYDGTDFVNGPSVALLAGTNSVAIATTGGAEPTTATVSALTDNVQIIAGGGSGDVELHLIAEKVRLPEAHDVLLGTGDETLEDLLDQAATMHDPDILPDTTIDGSERVAIKQAGAWFRTTAADIAALGVQELEEGILSDWDYNVVGVGDVGYDYKLLTVLDDSYNGAPNGAGKVDALRVVHAFGGATATGGRHAMEAVAVLNGTTSPTNPDRNYVGVAATAHATVSDGGTLGDHQGALFGINAVGRLSGTATHWHNVTAGEINTQIDPGCSVYYKSGLQITQMSGDAVRGYNHDGALCISDIIGAVGWDHGILFGDMNGQHPVSADGTLIATTGTNTCTNGLDIESYSFTGHAIKTKGFRVNGAGRVDLGLLGVENTAQIALQTGTVTTAFDSRIVAVGGNGTSGQGIMAIESGVLTLHGSIQVRLAGNIPVFADNAAALAGGLPATCVYRKATGELMTVF